MQDDKEAYLLLILSDANLPTGSFVASTGLESTAAHALFRLPTASPAGSDILSFLRNSVDTYARSALPFARDAHRIAAAYTSGKIAGLDVALAMLARLDALYDASTLNHVTRRASCAQGAALLTLYTKGFTRPPVLTAISDSMTGMTTTASNGDDDKSEYESRAGALVAALKVRMRRGDADAPGHLPVCWGVLAGVLGLTVGELAASLFISVTTQHMCLDRGAHLHLFLHARGVLSAAVRMNVLGPYAAQQFLLHAVKPMLSDAISSTAHIVSGELQDEGHTGLEPELPATTWPLGEILSARHDLLHSRIFNS
jgi:urease accessory protein